MAKVNSSLIRELKSLLTTIIASIVDNGESVHVNVVPGSYRVLAELHTAPDDVGQVIGKRGSVIDAVRLILSAFAGKHGVKVDLTYITERERDDERGLRR